MLCLVLLLFSFRVDSLLLADPGVGVEVVRVPGPSPSSVRTDERESGSRETGASKQPHRYDGKAEVCTISAHVPSQGMSCDGDLESTGVGARAAGGVGTKST